MRERLSPGEAPGGLFSLGRRESLEDETVEGEVTLAWFAVVQMKITPTECHYGLGTVQSPLPVLAQLFSRHSQEASVAPRGCDLPYSQR